MSHSWCVSLEELHAVQRVEWPIERVYSRRIATQGADVLYTLTRTRAYL